MPEGDTIHKVAAAIAERLEGARIERVSMRGETIAALAGAQVESVRAQGKHLFIATNRDRLIRTHLGMRGSWHRYGKGEDWKRPAYQAGLTLYTASDVFVCFNPKEVELLDARAVHARIVRDRIGPDLGAEGITLETIADRARQFLAQDTALVDVLLDQRIASGIGNVYKSELLFIERVAPLAPLRDTPDSVLSALYTRAHDLLRANLGGGPRITRFEGGRAGRLWVYRRARAPCLRCNTPIVSAPLGRSLRSTYWCPRCQAACGGEAQ